MPSPHFFRRVIFLLILASAANRARAAEVFPESRDEAGLRAWEMLGDYYKTGPDGKALGAALTEAFKMLDGEDGAAGAKAADFIQALLRQTTADEANGRAEWTRSMAWGGGADSIARNFRKELAARFAKSTGKPAAVPVAIWLLGNDKLPDALNAATKVLTKARHPAGDGALLKILTGGTHWRPALVMALEEAGTRPLKTERNLILKWANDPRLSIRTAAAKCMELQNQEPPPAFDPEKAYTAELETGLRNILALLPDPPDPGAVFGEFAIHKAYGDGTTHTSTEAGWLRTRTDGEVVLTNWFGETIRVELNSEEKARVEFKDSDPAVVVDELLAIRKKDAANPEKRLSRNGGLTGQFEPRMLSAPEGLFAAWLFSRHEKALAAKLFFPRLDEMSDDRWTQEILRDLIARSVHEEMLSTFSHQRNYPETIRLARHLAQPLFDGYNYQERARELAAQLPGRAEDFKTLLLPAPTAWKELSSGMTRQQQMEFLASRLRLLNCFQWGQPGNVSYHDDQYSVPGVRLPRSREKSDPLRVINPCNELLKLKPIPADIPVLAPFLKDENFLPTFSYWRNFHPARTLHRVNWVVAETINRAAMHELIDVGDWQEISPEAKDREVKKVTTWAEEMSVKPAWEIIRINMDRASGERTWLTAARKAPAHPHPELLNALLAGAERYPERKADIARLAFLHGGAGVLPAAGGWIKLEDPGLQIYSALSIIRHGTPEAREAALPVLQSGMMNLDSYEKLAAVEDLLSMKDDAVTGAACAILKDPKLNWRFTGRGLVHRLFLTKHPDALVILTELLSSTEDPHKVAGIWEDKEVERTSVRGDDVAVAAAPMRLNYQFQEYAPDGERVEARRELAGWLATQAALLKEGKPTHELDTDAGPASAPESFIDAP